ncbi:hypothetical protein BKA70DRAFT_1296343, partial [Coprinopsis sp. MPI-PUGE-AT-0042]
KVGARASNLRCDRDDQDVEKWVFHIPYWTIRRLPPKSPVRGGYALLGNLALTSRFLRDVAQRELFRSICIHPNQSSERLLAVFQNNPKLCHYVRACIVVVACLDPPGLREEVETPFVAAEVPLLMEGLRGLESFGLASKMRWVNIAWAHLPLEIRSSITRCWNSNAESLKAFCTTRNLLFPPHFLPDHLPASDEDARIGFSRDPSQSSSALARQIAASDDTELNGMPAPQPRYLAFYLTMDRNGLLSKASEEPEDLTPQQRNAKIFCELIPLPTLQHLEIDYLYYCRAARLSAIDPSIRFGDGLRNLTTLIGCPSSEMTSILLGYCVPAFNSILSLNVRFAWGLPSLDWGLQSAVGGMSQFFHSISHRLDEVFSQGHVFPSLKVIYMSLHPQVPQNGKTMKGYKERWEVNAAFVRTKRSDQVVLNIAVPKRLIVV